MSNLLSWSEDTKISSGNDTINSIIKKFVFHKSMKAIKKKLKIKSEFSLIHVFTETIKRIIYDLDIKKPSSGEIPTYFFKKCHFVLGTVTVCINKAIKTGSFPDSLKCANVRLVCKKVDPFYKKPVSILPLLLKVYERVIQEQASNYLNYFSIKICVDLKKHIKRCMFYFQIINFMEKFVK